MNENLLLKLKISHLEKDLRSRSPPLKRNNVSPNASMELECSHNPPASEQIKKSLSSDRLLPSQEIPISVCPNDSFTAYNPSDSLKFNSQPPKNITIPWKGRIMTATLRST